MQSGNPSQLISNLLPKISPAGPGAAVQWTGWVWLAVSFGMMLIIGLALMRLIRFALQKLAARAAQGDPDAAAMRRLEEMLSVVRRALVVVGLILTVALAQRAIRHPQAPWDPVVLLDWLLDRGVRLTLLIAGAYVAIKLANLAVSRVDLLIRPYDDSPSAEFERVKRAQTIRSILQKIVTVSIVTLTILMLLEEIHFNTTPILTSLGVAGVAIGFGAQQLVGDLIAGFFMIFENQIRVGDVAVINGTGGLVQDIRLRTIALRGQDGTVYIFRNGSIQTLANMTKDFSYFLMNLNVAYQENTDRVIAVVREVAEELQKDAALGPSILDPVEVLGVDNFAPSSVVIQFRIKTVPIKQWDVGREFRRRLKYRFEKDKIQFSSTSQMAVSFDRESKLYLVDGRPEGENDRAEPAHSDGGGIPTERNSGERIREH